MLSFARKVLNALTARERSALNGAVAVFTLSAILSGVTLFYESTRIAPIGGGVYREGIVGQPIAINPLTSVSNEVDLDLMELVFSDLAEMSDTPTVSEDHRVWNVVLDENLFWSDGEPITSEDVVFTLEAIQNPETDSPLRPSWQGVAVERLNDREVRFTLKTAYAFFADTLASFKIVPQHIFGTIPTANLRLSDYNFEPVSSGAYAFVAYEKRKDGFITSYHLRANPYYYRGKALIEDIRLIFFTDYDEAVDAFNGRIVDGLGGISGAHADGIKVNHELYELRIPRYYAIFFNDHSASPLADAAVREALVRAIDRSRLVDEVLNGRGTVAHGPIDQDIEGYDPTVSELSIFSKEKAAALLADADWVRGDDGVRAKTVKGNEVRLEFELIVPQIDFLVETAKLVVAMWEDVGVRATPVVLNPADVATDIIASRNYQMLLFGNILKLNPDVFSFWHSSEQFKTGLNLALYEGKEVDALLEAIRTTFDGEERGADVRELQRLIVADHPAAFLFSPPYLYAAPRSLGGLAATLLGDQSQRFARVSEWYLKTARVFK